MRKRIAFIELFKTIAVVFLMVTLVCLCVIYMLSYQRTETAVFTKDKMQELSGQSVQYQYADYLEASYVSPKWIGVSAKNFGENLGFFTLGGENEAIVNSVLPFYEKLFSSQGKVEKLTSEVGEPLFESLLADNYIYIAYETDLPKSIIYTLFSENSMLPAISDEYIREIVIAPGRYLYDGISTVPFGTKVYTSVYTFYAMARDSEGNYYRYTTEFSPSKTDDVCFNTNYYLSYTVSDTNFTYEFAGLYEADIGFCAQGFEERTYFTMPVISDSGEAFSGDTVSISTYTPPVQGMEELLLAFLINPERATSYTDAQGTKFYHDEGKNLSVSADGKLEYTSYTGQGLALSSLFEYRSDDESYDVRDYVGASLMLVRALEQSLGEDQERSLFLSGIYSDGTELSVSFGLAYGGVPIYRNGNAELMRFVFEGGLLKSASCELILLKVSKQLRETVDCIWQLRLALSSNTEKREYGYAYLFDDETESGKITVYSRTP